MHLGFKSYSRSHACLNLLTYSRVCLEMVYEKISMKQYLQFILCRWQDLCIFSFVS